MVAVGYGHWQFKSQDGRRLVLVECPKCRHWQTLEGGFSRDHGTVTSLFRCSYNGCDFAGVVLLDGWLSYNWSELADSRLQAKAS